MNDYELKLRGLSLEDLHVQLRGAIEHLEESKARFAADELAALEAEQDEAHNETMQREEIIRQILAPTREAALYQ